ncbi:MAG: DNA repair protein RadA, partial [Cellulomonas sp.]|nr:DNA repair protein RadA [Cellulomonas sp.]
RETVALPRGIVALGEVGLAGEIRPVTGVARRLAEAARLGFVRAVVPAGSVEAGSAPAGIELIEVRDLAEAVLATGVAGDR